MVQFEINEGLNLIKKSKRARLFTVYALVFHHGFAW
jgi:hypothetical protein